MHKNLVVRTRASSDKPVTFRLCGQRFRVKPRIPAGWLLEVLAAESIDARTLASEVFLRRIVQRNHRKRFLEVLASDELNLNDLVDLTRWLVAEVYTGFPTKPSLICSDGSVPNGQTSTGGASRSASILTTCPSIGW